jgi:hypothetical protein
MSALAKENMTKNEKIIVPDFNYGEFAAIKIRRDLHKTCKV